MRALNYISKELGTVCEGTIDVQYSYETSYLRVVISTDTRFYYVKKILPKALDTAAALTTIVKSIKLEYLSFLLDKYFKNI